MAGDPEVKGNGAWEAFLSSLPWIISMVALGGWFASQFNARLTNVERAVTRIEMRQESAQAEAFQELKDEVSRGRRAKTP